MNICVWSGSSFEKSYASYHLMEGLINALLQSKHNVWLVQMKQSTGILPKSFEGKINLHVVNIPWAEPRKTSFVKRYLNSIKYYKACEKEIDKIKSLDAIFLQSNTVAFFPINFCKKRKIPVVFNVQDIFPIDALVTGMLSSKHPAFVVSRWMMRYAYKKADRVVTISEDLKKTIVAEGREDVDVIYNWSYQNEPYMIAEKDNHFLNTYSIKREDGFRVVYAGNIGKMMNAEMIIQTAIHLKDYSDIKFYIIGTGSNMQYLTRRAKEENLKSILFFPPQPMEFAPDNYCMADININPVPKGVMYTCMPSKTNTCLLSLKPTVVSMDLDSDMAKRLSNVDLWTVVAPNDAEGMAEAILKQYRGNEWNIRSKDAGLFMEKLGPVENAFRYVRILEEAAEKNEKI